MLEVKIISDDRLIDEALKCGENIRFLRVRFANLLIEINARKLYLRENCHSIYEFAAKYAAMTHRSVREILRVDSYLKDLPELSRIFRDKGWSKVRIVAHLATPETDFFWAEKTMLLSKASLEEYVRLWKLKHHFKTREFESDLVRLSFKVTPKVNFQLRQLKQKLHKIRKVPINFNALMKYLLQGVHGGPIKKYVVPSTAKHIDVKKRLNNFKKFLPGEKRAIPLMVKRQVLEKFGSKCVFPCCRSPFDIFHHVNRWSLHKFHHADTILPLCKVHERIAHAGLVKNEDEAPSNWLVADSPDYESPKFAVDKHVIRHYVPG